MSLFSAVKYLLEAHKKSSDPHGQNAADAHLAALVDLHPLITSLLTRVDALEQAKTPAGETIVALGSSEVQAAVNKAVAKAVKAAPTVANEPVTAVGEAPKA